MRVTNVLAVVPVAAVVLGVSPPSVGKGDVQEPSIVVRYSTLVGGLGTDDCDAVAVDDAGAVYLGCHSNSADFPGRGAEAGPLRGGMDAFVLKLTPDGQRIGYVAQLGGMDWEAVQGIAVDASGYVYVVGASYSADLETTAEAVQPRPAGGEGDAFVARLDPEGAVVYMTYLGGSGLDDATGVALDAAGNAYVVGRTASPDFPISDGAWQTTLIGGLDAFVTKLDPSGRMVYSTYLGGTSDDAGQAIGLDSDGRVHVGGMTESGDFPLVEAVQTDLGGQEDGFVAVLNASGSGLHFATFLGGSGPDEITSLTLDPANRIYVAGLTGSSDLPVTEGAFQSALSGGRRDTFLAELEPLGTDVAQITYVGGDGNESRAQVVVGVDGEVYVAGGTESPDFPTALPLQAELRGRMSGYLVRLHDRQLVYSTYFGGSAIDVFEGAAPHPEGGIVVTGMSGSVDFPMRGGLGHAFAGGRGDIPVVRFDGATP